MPTRPILESENGIKIRLPILVTETLGMRYFFHVSGDGKTFEDETATVLPDALAARLHASVIAAELLKTVTSTTSSTFVPSMKTATKLPECRSMCHPNRQDQEAASCSYDAERTWLSSLEKLVWLR